MSEGMLYIRDVEGPKKTGSVETRLEAMEQQVFKCQGIVERGLNANHMMITEFTSNHKMDAIDIGKHLSRLYDRVDQLQGQIYDLQNQSCDYHEGGPREEGSRSCIVLERGQTKNPGGETKLKTVGSLEEENRLLKAGTEKSAAELAELKKLYAKWETIFGKVVANKGELE
ncbi:40S ribosomal protein S5-1 [Hordeum vulgare]|nr:40S ribosomal protein S5-1 [Hordeum vulgare]